MTLAESQAPMVPPEPAPEVSGRLPSLRTSRAPRWFALVLPPVLVGYALFDKAFAYVRIPPLPIFAGELLMILGLLVAVSATGHVRRSLEHSAVVKLLLLFAAWGLLRTLPNLRRDGIDAVRDSALWYYALLAIPVCAIVVSDPEILVRWARGYRRFIPWLLVFSPFASYLANHTQHGLAFVVPGSGVSIWEHKPGNIAVHMTIALAFLWLVPGAGGRFRGLLTCVATIALLVVATQNRSGFVAAVVGLALVWLFSARRIRMTFAIIATVLVVMTVGWGLNIQIRGDGTRTVSVEQFIQNANSLFGGDSADTPGNLEANRQFRERLWTAAIDKVKAEKKVLTGLGFGPDIAQEIGFADSGPAQLRSPHNSHIDIFARMGVIGLTLWVSLWAVWCVSALRTRKRLRVLGRRFEMALMEVCIVGVTAILVNAYFDPTLESPPVAIWLWTLVGLSVGITAISRRTAAFVREA